MSKHYREDIKETASISGVTRDEAAWASHEAHVDSLREIQRAHESDECMRGKSTSSSSHSGSHRRMAIHI